MDERVLEAIASLSAMVQENFQSMKGSLSDIETRLKQQESKTQKMSERQWQQEVDLAELKQIVLDLAEREPIKKRHDGIAISKEAAYDRFAGKGFGKVKATRALRNAGLLRTDTQGKNTITIWNNGGYLRVLLVTPEENAAKTGRS